MSRTPARPRLPLPCPPPRVVTRGKRRALEFVPGEVQSEMLLDDPTRLVLSYTRAIVCFALFVPRPRHIIMVGLGGGSLAKFCYRHFPDTRITVVELRADVIALRAQFAIPPDDHRFQVVHADATAWLPKMAGTADVLILDGFDQAGLPPSLGTPRFYGDCRRTLVDGGVLVTNIFSYDPHYPSMLARLRLMFDERLCWFDRVAGNNRILFAIRAPLAPAAAPRALTVQQWVARRKGLGSGLLNRVLVRAVLAWVAHAPSRSKRQHPWP